MVTKEECIFIFNAMIRGTPISFQEKLLPLISDYLTEIKYEKSDKIIYLIVQHPQLAEEALPKVIDYFCRKYNIFILKKISDSKSLFNNQIIILYYV